MPPGARPAPLCGSAPLHPSAAQAGGILKCARQFVCCARSSDLLPPSSSAQVVLPMLYNQCVDHTCVDPTSGAMIDCPVPSQSWMSTSQFYAGLALAQGE